MTFKALLYTCYARMGPLGGGSKGQGARAPLDNLCSFLAHGSNNKYSNKIIANMLHLSIETFNNEQVLKVFR